ncbi:hypothetical protein MHBO_000824, partial [Bonamia ostreae]
MPHSFGYRARTRKLFKKDHKQKGKRSVTVYQQVYRLGDYVDVVCDSSQQKGMPYKFYHGKTGKVWNVSKRAIGVLIKKVIGNREILKKIHVRIEHVRPSRCREDFLKRKRTKSESQKGQTDKIETKRKPLGPRKGYVVSVDPK